MTQTIEEAAREFAEREAEVGDIDRNALHKGYYWGAKDFMSQPLAARLTDAEKEKIRKEYADMSEYPTEHDMGYTVAMVRSLLERIFGKELFEGKEE